MQESPANLSTADSPPRLDATNVDALDMLAARDGPYQNTLPYTSNPLSVSAGVSFVSTGNAPSARKNTTPPAPAAKPTTRTDSAGARSRERKGTSGVRCSPALRARVIRGDYPAWLKVHPRRTYLVASICARVPWYKEEVDKIYDEARRLGLVVDHIIPLNHELVCGLTVPSNLQLLTWAQNAAKSNYWNPDQMELL